MQEDVSHRHSSFVCGAVANELKQNSFHNVLAFAQCYVAIFDCLNVVSKLPDTVVAPTRAGPASFCVSGQ